MELIFEIIRTTSASFDFALVISINIVNDALDRDISKWAKRGITCVCIIALSIIYHILGACDDELILPHPLWKERDFVRIPLQELQNK